MDKQLSSLSASAPSLGALYARSSSEACVWRIVCAAIHPSQWTEQEIGGQIKVYAQVSLPSGKVDNSFKSKTAALRANWSVLLHRLGKDGFSEKGSWGFPSFQATIQGVRGQVWQSILPFFPEQADGAEEPEVEKLASMQAVAQSPEDAIKAKIAEAVISGDMAAVSALLEVLKALRGEAPAPAAEAEVEASSSPVEAPAPAEAPIAAPAAEAPSEAVEAPAAPVIEVPASSRKKGKSAE